MPKCPRCGSDEVQRVRREGALELCSSLVRWCPFRCQLCTHRFHRFALAPRCWKADRRQYQRLVTQVRAIIPGKPSDTDMVIDLSMGGCRLKTQTPFATGALLHLRLHTSEPQRSIVVQMVMVRSVYSDSLGLQFIGLDPKQKQHLSHFIQTLLASQSPLASFRPHLSKVLKV